MALNLLNCSICPKRPNFSDTSHLLTHVSSKGHLSHLHKLQVRSHQEIAAGHQLVIYNQWYQQHGLGQLLSERMLQKEARSVNKTGNQPRARVKKENPQTTAHALRTPGGLPVGESAIPFDGAYKPIISRNDKRVMTPTDDSDFHYTPVRRSRRTKNRKFPCSPVKTSSSDNVFFSSEADCPAEIDPQLYTTPDNAKLKGVIWPGMAIFDAAPEEMRRRRNQKKDGKTLMLMEKTSALVEPTEVIYSPEGTKMKERFIDGNVDDSSPLRGETPIPKLQTRRRRQPLATINGNISRFSKRTSKDAQNNSTSDVRDLLQMSRTATLIIPSSSTGRSHEAESRFSPTEAEHKEFRLSIGNLSNRKRKGNFTIFNDRNLAYEPLFQHSAAIKHQTSLRADPFPSNSIVQPKEQPPFLAAPWLHPQNQQYAQHQSACLIHRSPPRRQTYEEKENIPWLASNSAFIPEHSNLNPLGWEFSPVAAESPFYLGDSAFSAQAGIGGFFGSMEDPFGGSKNPLSIAVGQYDGPQDLNEFHVKHRVASPDDTISEHGDAQYKQFESSD